MEEKDLQRLLDMLYGMIDEAKSAPFSAEKCTINRDEALDILTEIRSRMPLEIKKAQELIRAREEYIASAKKEVEKMLRQAELDAKTIVSESETLQRARMKSAEIIHRAEERTNELYRGQLLYRGCPAPHGGGYSNGPGRGAPIPHPFPRCLQ